MEKVLFFDAGPIITLVMARLVWVLPRLKEKYGGKFYITPAVKTELVERPLQINRFKFEALQVMRLIKDGVLEVYDKVPKNKVGKMVNLANSSFKIKNKNMDIIQAGEMESLISVLDMGAEGLVMDERTLRLFIESGKDLEKLLEMRFHHDVVPDPKKIKEFNQQFKSVTIIRSIELIATAYKMGLLDHFQPDLPDGKEKLVDAVLWSTKYNGCAVTNEEIEELKDLLLK